MSYSLLMLSIDSRGVASVTLNRPEIHNAFDDKLIAELTQAFHEINNDPKVRLAVLSGKGKSFCAGGDIHWMRSMKDYSREENIADSKKLSAMFESIHHFSKPLIGVVHGNALGGGAGLTSMCDFVIAADNATFGFTETRIGIVPSVISPYVIEKIGLSYARAYFLSGMRFPANIAKEMALVHRVVPPAELEKARDEIITEFLKAGPEAAQRGKALIAKVSGGIRKEVIDYTVQTISEARVSAEGQEGMSALLEGRKPKWVDA